MSQRRFLSVLAAFAVAMATLSVAVQPSLAEDDDDEPNFMSKVFGSIGLLQLPGPGIEYQERPPLVVPPITTYVQPQLQPNTPSAQPDAWDFSNPRQQAATPQEDNRPQINPSLVLPPPLEANTVRQRNPDFPVDPETRAVQKRKKTKTRMFSRAEDDPTFSGRLLRPDEMRGERPNPNAQSSGTNPNANEAQSSIHELNVPGLGRMTKMFGREQEKPIEFTGEPERQTLTQPPSGYLTPSKNAPYGTVQKDRTKDTTRMVHPNMPDAPNFPGQ